MTSILIYTDFDGTVTKRDGSKTVFSRFYQSLLEGDVPGVLQNYRGPKMENSATVQSLFEKKFGKYDANFDYAQRDADLLMSSEAVAFFHGVLSNDNVAVNIITKNRCDYIKELLTYHGFSQNEIEKINIMDSGLKNKDVNFSLQCQEEAASHLYILDDSKDDYNEMMLAARTNGYQEHQIHGDNKAPGAFEWPRYLSEISAMCSTTHVENEIDTSSIEEQPKKETAQSLIKPRAEKTASITLCPGTLFALARPNSVQAVDEAQKDLCDKLSSSR